MCSFHTGHIQAHTITSEYKKSVPQRTFSRGTTLFYTAVLCLDHVNAVLHEYSYFSFRISAPRLPSAASALSSTSRKLSLPENLWYSFFSNAFYFSIINKSPAVFNLFFSFAGS